MAKEALSLTLTDAAVAAFSIQSDQLKRFVKDQLREGVDFATLKGTEKPTLLKPGAEKLARIFGLGNRVLDKNTEIDHKTGFAVSTVTIEVFHVASGLSITQSLGSANTFEPSQKNKHYATALNHVLKVAQKRAYVGAIIIAVGASDFFTQDLEEQQGEEPKRAVVETTQEPTKQTLAYEGDAGAFRVPFGQNQGSKLDELSDNELAQLEKWVNGKPNPTGKVLQCKLAIERYRRE